MVSTVLLIEDASDLAGVISRESEAAGYRVLHAGDGVAALGLYASHKPNLVILDWNLPGIDGLEVLRRLRQSSAVPVLMLTARSEEMNRSGYISLATEYCAPTRTPGPRRSRTPPFVYSKSAPPRLRMRNFAARSWSM